MGLRCCGSPPRQLAGSRSPADKTEKLCCCPFYLPAAEVSSSSHHQVTFFGCLSFRMPIQGLRSTMFRPPFPEQSTQGRTRRSHIASVATCCSAFFGHAVSKHRWRVLGAFPLLTPAASRQRCCTGNGPRRSAALAAAMGCCSALLLLAGCESDSAILSLFSGNATSATP